MESFTKDKKNINYVQNSAWKNRYGRLDQYFVLNFSTGSA